MIIFANNAVTTLANPLLSSQTTLTVLATTGELFPVPGVGEYFKLTLEDRRNRTIEITHCTGRAGDILTIVRAQEDTLALDFAVGSTVANRFTRDSADAILAQVTPANPWYLGPFATAPVLDNEGNPLVAGQQYWNTTSQIFFIYTGASWVDQNTGTSAISSVNGTYALQDPSAGFNGVLTDFNLRYIDYAAAVQTPDVTVAEQFLVFLDGVRIKPGDDYTIPVLGTLRFVVPPTADQSFTGLWVAVTSTGPAWFTGAGAPSGALGVVGDWYFNTTTPILYRKTGVATWTNTVAFSVVQAGLPVYVLRNFTGTANAQAADTGFTLAVIPQYTIFKGIPVLNCTGPMTLAIDAVAAKPLKSPTGAALAADEWNTTHYYDIIAFDNPLTEYRIVQGY